MESINSHLVNVAHRLTGYDEDVISEYIKINDGKYSILANLTIKGIETLDPEYRKVLMDLHYLNRKMKILKLIENTSR